MNIAELKMNIRLHCCFFGRYGGGGRGSGRGQGKNPNTNSRPGPGGYCVCPKCGHREKHVVGERCLDKACPSCGTMMVRE